jgi:hypothetical protein
VNKDMSKGRDPDPDRLPKVPNYSRSLLRDRLAGCTYRNIPVTAGYDLQLLVGELACRLAGLRGGR